MRKSILERYTDAKLAGRAFNIGKEHRALKHEPPPASKHLHIRLDPATHAAIDYMVAEWKRRGAGVSKATLINAAIVAHADRLRQTETDFPYQPTINKRNELND